MRTPSEVVAASAAATARDRLMIDAHGRGTLDEPGDQLAALLDTARVLSEAGFSYAVIGGIAVGIHSATPRATEDVDVAVASSIERERIAEVLTAAGFEPRGTFPHSLNFRHPSGEPVQVAIDPTFDVMILRGDPVIVNGVSVVVVSKADLITMKERSSTDPARRRSKALRDQADVELLRGDVPDPDEGW